MTAAFAEEPGLGGPGVAGDETKDNANCLELGFVRGATSERQPPTKHTSISLPPPDPDGAITCRVSFTRPTVPHS